MKYDTIQMDQDSNTIPRAYSSLRHFLGLTVPVRHDWRDLFESDRWALMPSTDIIGKLWDRWVKFDLRDGNVPSIEDVRFPIPLRYVDLDSSSDVRWCGDF